MKSNRSLFISSLTLFLLLTSCGIAHKDMSICTYERGYWGRWTNYSEFTRWAFQGRPDNFIVYNSFFHPSSFCYRVIINNYNSYRVNSGRFEEFSGTIEVFSFGNNFTASDFIHYSLQSLEPGTGKLVSYNAKISVKKENKQYVYNIFFDNVGFAVTIPWQKSK